MEARQAQAAREDEQRELQAIGGARLAIPLSAATPEIEFTTPEQEARAHGLRETAHGSRFAKPAVMAADVVTIAASMLAAAAIADAFANRRAITTTTLFVAVVSLPVWVGVFARYKLYKTAAVTSRISETNRILHAVAAATACTGVIAIVFAQNISRVWLVCTFAIAFVLVTLERNAVRHAFARQRAHGRLMRSVVVVGTNAEAIATVQMLNDNAWLGYRVVGLLTGGETTNAFLPPTVGVLGDCGDAVSILRDVGATGAIVTTSAIEEAAANRLARDLTDAGFHVEITSGLVDISADRLLAHPLGRRPVLYVEPVHRVGWRAAAKRLFDLMVAGTLLVLSSPVLAICAVLIKIDSRGPVFFSQVRVGKDGRLFRFWKLRTMVPEAEHMLDSLRDRNEMDGPLFKMRNDPRVTRVGSFLRRWSIDEIPQLWNVIRGEMSLVGPRPAIPTEVAGWSEELRGRLRVKPGVTGMWQVNGRSHASFDDYVRHDLYYVDNWSLLTDLAIVAKTVPVVLLHRDAY